MLLRQVAVVHHQFQIGILMLIVGLLQAHAERSLVLELLRLVDVELVVIAFALLLQEHQLIMRVGNRSGQLRAGIAQIALRGGQVTLRRFNSFALRVQLRLHLLPTRVLAATVMRRLCCGPANRWCGRWRWRGRRRCRLRLLRCHRIHLGGKVAHLAARSFQRRIGLLILRRQITRCSMFVYRIAAQRAAGDYNAYNVSDYAF